MSKETVPEMRPKEVDSTTAELAVYLLEESEDRKTMRVSLWGAVAIHALFLLINFPAFQAEPQVFEPKERKVFVLSPERYQPTPPPPPPEIQRRARRVPIPDPTPDEIEPLRLAEPPPELDVELDAEIPFVIPDAPPAAEEPVGPIPVGGDVVRPVKVYAPPPRYTELARRARIQGQVFVEAILDKGGEVTQVRLLKGLPMGLSEAALEAVKTWKFKPATLNGKPVEVYYNLTVIFTLQ